MVGEMDGRMDVVTGATVAVRAEVNLAPEQVWALITEVSRIGEWSPECRHGAWLDTGGPRVGARFQGRNRFAGGFEATTTCVVTEAEPSRVFAWAVLDDEEALDRAGSWWRYDLVAGSVPGHTRLRHRFTHGLGRTGMRVGAEAEPGRAEEKVARRLDTLSHHMCQTLRMMLGSSLRMVEGR
jgi:uncharacterized protein YndB with AHSA1/START domain